MIALLFLAGCLVWGWALLRLTGVVLERMERAVIGSILGLATGGWLLYWVASRFEALGTPALATTLAIFAVAAVATRFRPKPTVGGPVPRWFLVLAVVVLLVLIGFNLFGVLAPVGAGFAAAEHVWADTPFHSSIITSFAYRDAYPPDYPLALGQPLNYPFLVDFLSGALLRYGFGLRGSLIVVNVAVQASFLLGLALIVHRLSSSVRASVVAVVVFFLLGNFGWLAVPGDVSDAGGVGAWLRNVPWSYTGETAGVGGRDRLGTGLYLGNPIFLHLLPRRSAAFGMAVGATALLLLDDLVRHKRAATAIVLGLLAGVLPRVHAHTAIVMALVALVWVTFEVFSLRRDRRAIRPLFGAVAITGAVATIIGLPEILAMREQTGSFFAFWPGWTGEPREAFTGAGLADVPGAILKSVWFWILNGGVLLLLLPVAWPRGSERLRRWYAPFIVVWLLGFLVRTQPWEWDNNNHFVWWQAASVVLVAPLIASWLGSRSIVRVAGVAAIVGLTLGGGLSFAYAAEHRLHLWSHGDMQFARDVRLATPTDAVILTANGHGHPVIALSGRQTVMGYWGWFTAHGLDGPRYERDVNAMLAGDVARMRRLGIDYVVLGPWEEAQAADKKFELADVFGDRGRFEVVLEETIDGRTWQLLRRGP